MRKLHFKCLITALAIGLFLQSFYPMLNRHINVAALQLENNIIMANSTTKSIETNSANSECGLTISAKSAYLMDFDTQTCMFEKNSNEKLPIASMCKIMTLLLTFEGVERGVLSENERITVSEHAASMGGSQAFLRANEDYLVSDLIKSIVIASANDSCVALAERISGSVDVFVKEMNEKALSLGMKDTVFQNCTGLPKPGQFSTAKDVAIMLSALLNHSQYYNYSQIWMDEMPHKDGTHTELANTNKLVRFYDGCDGGKTGYTQEAKFCLAATAKRGDLRLISVIIGAESGKTRFKESSELLSYGFAQFVNEKVVSEETVLEEATVRGGKDKTVCVKAQHDVFCLVKRGEKPLIQTTLDLQDVQAPIKAGTTIGTLSVYKEGVLIKEVPVVAANDVPKRTVKDILEEIFRNFPLKKEK
ncbi:MAG: D-alanyl-D-alanine carboxypeptidase [Clostridiales bacterium]|nr:D-alanyl-D-alanine carboxypeptidase [Clostridiales bacterium]